MPSITSSSGSADISIRTALPMIMMCNTDQNPLSTIEEEILYSQEQVPVVILGKDDGEEKPRTINVTVTSQKILQQVGDEVVYGQLLEFTASSCESDVVYRQQLSDQSYMDLLDDGDKDAPTNLLEYCRELTAHFRSNRMELAHLEGDFIIITTFPSSPGIPLEKQKDDVLTENQERSVYDTVRDACLQGWNDLTRGITETYQMINNPRIMQNESYISFLRREITNMLD